MKIVCETLHYSITLCLSGVLAGGWDVAKNAAMLVQPGGSVGCGGTLCVDLC